jgi:uncharacterized membrane protein YhiD involved in acid resistance
MLAAIGSTIGAGRPLEALVLAILVVGILIVVRTMESAFKRLRGGSDEPDAGPPDPQSTDLRSTE